MRQITVELDETTATRLEAVCAGYGLSPDEVVAGTLRHFANRAVHFERMLEAQNGADKGSIHCCIPRPEWLDG